MIRGTGRVTHHREKSTKLIHRQLSTVSRDSPGSIESGPNP
jgi:hypothetical protein